MKKLTFDILRYSKAKELRDGGMTHKEIGKQLDVSPARVRQMLVYWNEFLRGVSVGDIVIAYRWNIKNELQNPNPQA